MIGPRRQRHAGGQAMVELALVAPLFFMLIFGIIVVGLGVFYQQQVTNAAREGARYASVHSATARCPTVSNEVPGAPPDTYSECDKPSARWPFMTAAARGYIFGIPASEVHLSACWSGYVDPGIDAPPADLAPPHTPNMFAPCTIGGVDPNTSAADLSCPAPITTAADDTASSMSASYGLMANEVTVYACYAWQPPLAGFLLIPQAVTLRGVVTEKLEYQQ